MALSHAMAGGIQLSAMRPARIHADETSSPVSVQDLPLSSFVDSGHDLSQDQDAVDEVVPADPSNGHLHDRGFHR